MTVQYPLWLPILAVLVILALAALAVGALNALVHRIRLQDTIRRGARRHGYRSPVVSTAAMALRETVGGIPFIERLRGLR